MESYPSIIYGVVRSRRLKASLGINLMPTGYKLCPFRVARDPGFEPSLSDVERVQAYRVKKLGPDWLPFRGGGSLGNIF